MKKIVFPVLLLCCSCSHQREEPSIPQPAIPVMRFIEGINLRDSQKIVLTLSDSLKKQLYDGSQMTMKAFSDSMGERHFLAKIKRVDIDSANPNRATIFFALTETSKNKTVDSLYLPAVREHNEWKLTSMAFQHL